MPVLLAQVAALTILLDRPAPALDLSAVPNLPAEHLDELLCKAHPGVWAEKKRGFDNSPLHWEWYDLVMTAARMAVVAPREHAKTEVFTVNATAWRCIYTPGLWTYIFAQTGDQAVALKARIDQVIETTAPWMITRAKKMSSQVSQYANFSMVTCAGAGKGVRGAHPDVIIGDDVLSEGSSMTAHQRKKTREWWFGTVSGMEHPGVVRDFGGPSRFQFGGTRVFLVGTPFHAQDLLMDMRENPLYRFRRYQAEFDPNDLVDGLAVEVS